MRPANIVTAVSDILAGIAISGYFLDFEFKGQHSWPVMLLILSTIGLYGGGVVFNDVFDAELDKVERPERPIPSGLIPKEKAALLGSSLLAFGVLMAFFVARYTGSYISALISFSITAAALVYDFKGKHHPFIGPLNMGLCRGLNLLLGISIIPAAVGQYGHISFIPIIYIAAITMISRGEVHGGSKTILYIAAALYLAVLSCILSFAADNNNLFFALFFILMLAFMIFPPLYKAIKQPIGKNIGKAVKAGVIALILMNASWAAAFGFSTVAGVILLLLPLSILLAKAFAVT